MGLPMVFVRLAGCSVGCEHCDTDYRVHSRLETEDIVSQVKPLLGGNCRWVWLTGGEPTDHELKGLIKELRSVGAYVALATAGTRLLFKSRMEQWVDFLSVSPHDPEKWEQRCGDHLNIVPGLNGFYLKDFAPLMEQYGPGFTSRYVTPLAGRERIENVRECEQWVQNMPGWRLGVQAHKVWGIS